MQAIRLIAAIIAKNAVGSSWRKTLGSREWSKVPDEEKAAVRSTAARLLLSEDSNRVSVQLGLLITNIARYQIAEQSNISSNLINFFMALQTTLLICLRKRDFVLRPQQRPLTLLACRFDFPGQWPSLLSDLGGAAAWGSPMHAVAKQRMLFTLKNVLRALCSKRFVVEAPSSVGGLSPEGAFLSKCLAHVLPALQCIAISAPIPV